MMILVDEGVDVAIPFVIPAAIVGRKVGTGFYRTLTAHGSCLLLRVLGFLDNRS
ncbi:hypothetical protein Hanom_Chr16g01458361 [Helianthus anomalus]